MRYLIITTMGPFYSNWILQPNWNNVIMIIDTQINKYTDKKRDLNTCDPWKAKKLTWVEVPEDNL